MKSETENVQLSPSPSLETAPAFTAGPWVRSGTIVSDHVEIDIRLDDEGDNWITIKGDSNSAVEANAALVIASPAMYEALKAIADQIEEFSDDEHIFGCEPLIEASRAALLLASGKPTGE